MADRVDILTVEGDKGVISQDNKCLMRETF